MPIVIETLEDHLRWQFGSLILQVVKSAKRIEELEAALAVAVAASHAEPVVEKETAT